MVIVSSTEYALSKSSGSSATSIMIVGVGEPYVLPSVDS